MRGPSARQALALGAVVVGLAAPVLRHRLRLPRPLVSALAWQSPFAFALARPRSPGRDAGVYTLQMLAYVAHYEMPNDEPHALLRRVRVDYPIRVDRVLGCGEVPAVRLQRALFAPRVRAHDVALSCVHWAWFVVPHASLGYVLWRRPDLFRRSACLMAGVFDLGLVVYWAVPTAPPWWAAARGKLPPVHRIMIDVGERFWGRLWSRLYDALAGNPLAAMPSLHFATSVMAAHVLSDVGRAPGAIGFAYAATLGFALVYLGEHYVLDLAAGLALCEAVRRLGPRAEPLLRAVAGGVARLDQRAA